MYPVVTRVQAPDLGYPSCAPWIFPLIPRPIGPATRYGRPDLGPPSAAAKIFAALPTGSVAQRVAAIADAMDVPMAPPTPYPDSGPAPRPLYWFRVFSQIKGIDTITVWQPNVWAVDSPPAMGWLQRQSVTIQQQIPAIEQARFDIPAISLSVAPTDFTNSISWVKQTFPVATAAQFAGSWSQPKAIDPGMYPPWLPEPGPFDPFVAKVAIIPATVSQRAGIWSQLITINPGPPPADFFDGGKLYSIPFPPPPSLANYDIYHYYVG